MRLGKEEILARCAEMCKNTLMETLDISFTDVGEDYLIAQMPVNSRVYQPDGVLHGGAMVALAESVGSLASYIFLNTQDFYIRGIEIAANHVRSVSEGNVTARASMIHNGRTTQLWDIVLRDDEDRLVSKIKLTTIALPKK